MSYLAHAKMAEDRGLIIRVAACAATLGILDAKIWTATNMWMIVAHPGWSQLYDSAASGEETYDDPGWYGRVGSDPAIITDSMILESVQRVIAILYPPEPPAETPIEAPSE